MLRVILSDFQSPTEHVMNIRTTNSAKTQADCFQSDLIVDIGRYHMTRSRDRGYNDVGSIVRAAKRPNRFTTCDRFYLLSLQTVTLSRLEGH
jgi:hypothetical protein